MGTESRYSIVQDLTDRKNECLDEIDALKTVEEDSEEGLNRLRKQNVRVIETLEKKIQELDKALEAIQSISESATK